MSRSSLPEAYQNLPLTDQNKTLLATEFLGFSRLFTLSWKLVRRTFLKITLPYFLTLGAVLISTIVIGVLLFTSLANYFEMVVATVFTGLYALLFVPLNIALIFLTRVTYLRRLAGHAVPLWSVWSGEQWKRAAKYFLVFLGIAVLTEFIPGLFETNSVFAGPSQEYLLLSGVLEGLSLVLSLVVTGLVGTYGVIVSLEGTSFDALIPLAYRASKPYFWLNALRWFWLLLILVVLVAGCLLVPLLFYSFFWLPFSLFTSEISMFSILSFFLPLIIGLLIYPFYLTIYDAFHLLATANLRAFDENRGKTLDN